MISLLPDRVTRINFFDVQDVMCVADSRGVRGLTVKLQSHSLEIFSAYSDINNVATTLRNVREEIENNHHSYFDKASDLAARIGNEISAPRRCGRQRHRGNVPATTAIEYYCREVTVPFIYHLIGEVNNRFFNGQENIVPEAFSLHR